MIKKYIKKFILKLYIKSPNESNKIPPVCQQTKAMFSSPYFCLFQI